MQIESDPDMYRGKNLDQVLKLAETQNGRVPPTPQVPAGMGANNCRVLAQVLGFKFTYYQANGRRPTRERKKEAQTTPAAVGSGFAAVHHIAARTCILQDASGERSRDP